MKTEYVEIYPRLTMLVNDIEVGYLEYNSNKDEVEITDLFIFVGYRGNGFGKKLLEEVCNRHKGCAIESKYNFSKLLLETIKETKS